MTQQILYAAADGEILQWQDTGVFSYPPLPEGGALLVVTPAQWAAQATPQYVANPGTATAMLAPGAQPVPLAVAQAAQIGAINAACQDALAAIVEAYPDLEVATWPQQYAEAQAVTANAGAVTPILSAISTASGSGVASLAAGVIAKAAAYLAASGAVIGKRQALTASVAAAATVDAVQAIIW